MYFRADTLESTPHSTNCRWHAMFSCSGSAAGSRRSHRRSHRCVVRLRQPRFERAGLVLSAGRSKTSATTHTSMPVCWHMPHESFMQMGLALTKRSEASVSLDGLPAPKKVRLKARYVSHVSGRPAATRVETLSLVRLRTKCCLAACKSNGLRTQGLVCWPGASRLRHPRKGPNSGGVRFSSFYICFNVGAHATLTTQRVDGLVCLCFKLLRHT